MRSSGGWADLRSCVSECGRKHGALSSVYSLRPLLNFKCLYLVVDPALSTYPLTYLYYTFPALPPHARTCGRIDLLASATALLTLRFPLLPMPPPLFLTLQPLHLTPLHSIPMPLTPLLGPAWAVPCAWSQRWGWPGHPDGKDQGGHEGVGQLRNLPRMKGFYCGEMNSTARGVRVLGKCAPFFCDGLSSP